MSIPDNNKNQYEIGGSISNGILDIGVSGGAIGGSVFYDLKEQQFIGGSVNFDILTALNIEVSQIKCTQFITITLSDPTGFLETSWTIDRKIPECQEKDDNDSNDNNDGFGGQGSGSSAPEPLEIPNNIETGKCYLEERYDGWVLAKEVSYSFNSDRWRWYFKPEKHAPDGSNPAYANQSSDIYNTLVWLYRPTKGKLRRRTSYYYPGSASSNTTEGTYITDRTFFCHQGARKYDRSAPDNMGDYIYNKHRLYGDRFHTETLEEYDYNYRIWLFYLGNLVINEIEVEVKIINRKATWAFKSEEEGPFPEKSIEYPKMSKKCCKDREDKRLSKYIKKIYEVLDPESIEKSSIPKRFLYLDGEGKHEMKTYGDILEAIIRMIDFQSFIRFSAKTKQDASGKNLDLTYHHQSQAFQDMLNLLVDTEKDVDENKDAIARLILLCSQITLTSVETNKAVASIVEYLGYETKDRIMDVKLPVNPLFSIELNADDEDINDKALAALTQPTEQPVTYVENVQPKGLQSQLMEINKLAAKPSKLKDLTR